LFRRELTSYILAMDNPCFHDDGGAWKSKCSVYAIDVGPTADNLRNQKRVMDPRLLQSASLKKEWGGWKLEFLPSVAYNKITTFVSAFLFATLITMAATGSLLYTLRNLRSNYTVEEDVTSESWTAEMLVSGEFRILNEPYRATLLNASSPDFQQLSTRISQQLNSLFQSSLIWEEFRSATVHGFSPGLLVRCNLVLQAKDSLTISKVGLSFLSGLKHLHGHLWLGPFSVDVQSIGFTANTEEVMWSQWSDWSECLEGPDGLVVRSRKRVCLSLSGLKLSRLEACQALSKNDSSDTETELCGPEPTATYTTSTQEASPSTLPLASSSTEKPLVMSSPKIVEANSSYTGTTTDSSSSVKESNLTEVSSSDVPIIQGDEPSQIRKCGECLPNEVCVALGDDLVPVCREMIDPSDPTGCGGHCKLNTEVCHRLQKGSYRCLDDSKCLDEEWRCGNNLCIPLVKRCDGHFNCYDHTDEFDCDCDLQTHFRCGKNFSCIPKSKRCDGIVDCWDAADESNCTIACLDSTQFTCNDSQCIPSKNFCDGFPDCKDHSDEPFGCGGVCKTHEWRCNNGRCILKKEVCNEFNDCGDNSDEIKCGTRPKRKSGQIAV